MPISLFSIPSHISQSVIQKFDLSDFVNFQKCSLKSFKAATNVKTRFTIESPSATAVPEQINLYFEYSNEKLMLKFRNSNESYSSFFDKPFRDELSHFPVRFENCNSTLKGVFTDDFCISLVNFIQITNSSMDYVYIRQIGCSPDSLKQLVETHNVRILVYFELLPANYMKINQIKNNSFFHFDFMEETEILVLDALRYHISSSNLTSRGINQMLKELLDDRKRIIYTNIHTNQPLEKDIIFEGISIIANFTHETVITGEEITYHVVLFNDAITLVKIDLFNPQEPKKRCLKRKLVENASDPSNTP